QLETTPADVGKRALDLQARVGANHLAWFESGLPLDPNAACHDQTLRLSSILSQTALDEQPIESLLVSLCHKHTSILRATCLRDSSNLGREDSVATDGGQTSSRRAQKRDH